MILLIDSETLRKPFNQRYCYPQDQQVIKGCLPATEKAAQEEKWKIYTLVDYERLPKSSMLDINQAKYMCSYFLNMFPAISGCYLIADDLETEIYLYSRIDEPLEQTYSRYCFNGFTEAHIELPEYNHFKESGLIKFIRRHYSEEILFVCDSKEAERVASDSGISFMSGAYWLSQYSEASCKKTIENLPLNK
ncbi:MAG: hypothetical protein QNJ54_01610 [Prochloraceae cyanobacterium]|nr:hypothetical protein [Prochloraceae cyanobacterium]